MPLSLPPRPPPLTPPPSLPDPQAFLAALPSLLTPRGVVAIVSPFSWLEEYTAQSKWLGGVVRGGEAVGSAEAFGQAMSALGFECLEQSDVPFLIREHGGRPPVATSVSIFDFRLLSFVCKRSSEWRLPAQRASSSGAAVMPRSGGSAKSRTDAAWQARR